MNTITGISTSEYIINKSKFISIASVVKCESDADDLIKSISQKYPDSNHVVFAYRLTNGVYRFSDNGEPKNSAGKPVLNILEKNSLYNVLLAVVRYFGGIKLGVGGLARAYSHTASLALNMQQITPLILSNRIKIVCTYENHSFIKNLIKSQNGYIESEEFSDNVAINIVVPVSVCDEMINNYYVLNGTILEENIYYAY